MLFYISKRILKKMLVTVFCMQAVLWLIASAYADVGGVIDAAGIVAYQERKLLFDSLGLMLIVVLPVIIMSFGFAYRFRASRRLGEYKPEWSHNNMLELLWWGIPAIIIMILGIMVWKKTHELDPYRPIDVAGEQEVVEVVALQWKWLFIYPQEGIATVGDLYIPVNKQIKFKITADAPMSAFAIPQLAGQIYAMEGMQTLLHIYTTRPGIYEGLNTQLNGAGFSYMHFPVHVVSQSDFDNWIATVKLQGQELSLVRYGELFKPTMNKPPEYYKTVPKQLFSKIMMQYTMPDSWLHEW